MIQDLSGSWCIKRTGKSTLDVSNDTQSYLIGYRPIAQLMMLMVSVDVSTVILSVVYRPTIVHVSVNCRSGLGRLSVDI